MKQIREEKFGGLTLRLVDLGKKFGGIAISDKKGKSEILVRIEGAEASAVWEELRRAAGQQRSEFHGHDGARKRFRSIFPAGFSDPGYADHERDYKIAAKRKLDRLLPLNAAAQAEGAGEAALAAYRATNLLSSFEQARVQAVLRGPTADGFLRAAAAFTHEPEANALQSMADALRPEDAAKWTIVSYLPFLWQPERHMFLKPNVTHRFAERVGHPFFHEYAPRLDIAVYRSLLDMTGETARELSDLQPADNIDIQSFIWVVGSYDDPEPSS